MDAARLPNDEVAVTFRYEEVLVLSDALSRWERDGTLDSLPFADQAERRVLWDLTASFEPLIDEAMGDTYGHAVERARSCVRDSVD